MPDIDNHSTPRTPRDGPADACPGSCTRGQCPASAPCEPSGILNIDKPAGWTSHDVVARVRRLTGQRRVGHAGTLDPFATGVLLLCLGQATRVSEYLMEARKLYRATVRFGTATDTYDATGTVTAESAVLPSRQEIEALLPRFVGRIMQAPPAYSALKRGGEPSYRRARRGETVEQAPRPVEIYDIALRSWSPPDLEIDVLCGKGTYIRSLAHDLGLALGSAAHLATLERRAVGHFTIDEALPLDELETAIREGYWQDLLYPLDEALLQYPALVVSHQAVDRILHGQPIDLTAAGASSACPPTGSGLCRAYTPDGEFIAILEAHAPTGAWRPAKVFAPCA